MNEMKAGLLVATGDSLDGNVESLLGEQIDDWNKGTPHPVRDYLGRRPNLLGRSDVIVELVTQEFLLRQRRGETPRPEDYVADFPELSESLQRRFEVLALSSDMKSPTDGEITTLLSPNVVPEVPSHDAVTVPTIHGFVIERVIGRGGMGIVYLAQHLGLKRKVALKLLQESRTNDPGHVARLKREAAAAARCQHPNLVQIHDIGEHAGQPYLALEYVEGDHLGRKLAGEPQPPRRAAELVETLARAIDHAHSQGVVHRDLKPANVLLTADGQPKITDFGLAKLKDSSTQTEVGAVLGTLAYMAPEQVQSQSDDIGPRTDIHALGEILYEALTGQPPYRAETPQKLIHAILNEEITAPSSRQSGIPRDLEAICLKCLEKEPRRRYDTASALADDLRRFLAGEPVQARSVGPAGRAWRWCRRNPKLASVSAVLAATVLAAISGFTGLTYRHNNQLREEVKRTAAKAAEARRHYQEARSTIQAMLARLNDRRFAEIPRLKELTRDLMEDALAFYERTLREVGANDPDIQVDTARAFGLLSTMRYELGQVDQAERLVQQALDLIARARSADPKNLDYLGLQVECFNRLTNYRLKLGRIHEATADGEETVRLAELLVRETPDHGGNQELLAVCVDSYAGCQYTARHLEEARKLYRRAVEIRDMLDPAKLPELRERQAGSLMNEGVVLWNLNQFADAVERFERVEKVLLSVPEEQLNVVGGLGQLYMNWSGVLLSLQKFDKAIDRCRVGLRRIDAYLGREPNDARAREKALGLHGNCALALAEKGDHRESANEWARVIESSTKPIPAIYHAALALELFKAGELERAHAAAQNVKAPAGISREQCYNLACLYSLSAAAARKDAKLSPDDRPGRVKSEISQALVWLKAAADAGFFKEPANVDHAKKDSDLEILRENPAFLRILNSGMAQEKTDAKPSTPAASGGAGPANSPPKAADPPSKPSK
jgi:serine/threonine-protein kinase